MADAGSYIRLQTCGVGALLRYDDLTEHEEKRFEEGLKGGSRRTVRTIAIDDWLFNSGRTKFQHQLLFENGRVARMHSLNYGY